MFWRWGFILLLLITIPVSLFAVSRFYKIELVSPLTKDGLKLKEKPLDKYTFSNLRKKTFANSKIIFGDILKEDINFVSKKFYFYDQDKKVSGVAHFPKKGGVYPIIVLFRGYVDREKYSMGEGSRRVGETLAQNGYIALAPDFLGYGDSSMPSQNPIEERFQTYTTALSLLTSLENINLSLKEANSNISANIQKIGIWGHSNGGHIALSVLAITSKPYPTVVWAPVTKPFPYSILYYTDEFDDKGKMLRKVVSSFEKDYNADNFTFINYLDWIQAAIQLHQGTLDEAVPQKWSDQFVQTLKEKKKTIDYFVYPDDDHNLAKGGWSTAVSRSISFYNTYFNRK